MSLQTDIKSQIIEAMKAKDAVRVSVLRGLSAAFVNELVAKKRKPDEELSNEEALAVISKEARKRKDSIEQFEKGGRADLAESEKAELVILEKFLPAQMSYEEVLDFVKQKQAETGMTDKAKAGQFMGSVMKDLKDKADGQVVKQAIDSLFA
ncbi:GatB/YqeY domain-containing protein [Candidatus Parcubacteria bacterium]|nr:GatB/YqeY domain-containing protein [Candidatus Parcubacteria bacterium]